MVRRKRGHTKLRDAAREIGIGHATLMRVESGRIPDIETFGKICNWLGVDPGSFLGFDARTGTESQNEPESAMLQVAAHFRAPRAPERETVNALAKMILFAAKNQHATKEIPDDEDS
jgi:transcriptional regulator with XRE-family HTH domain